MFWFHATGLKSERASGLPKVLPQRSSLETRPDRPLARLAGRERLSSKAMKECVSTITLVVHFNLYSMSVCMSSQNNHYALRMPVSGKDGSLQGFCNRHCH